MLHRAGFSIGVVHHRPWPTSRTKVGREAAAQLCAQAWCWPIIMQGMCHLLVAKFLFSQNVLLQLQSCLLLLRSSSACLIGPASWQLAKGESWVGGSCVSCAQTSVAHNSLALCPACSCVSGCLSIPGAAAAWACQPRAVADSSTVSCCHLGPAKQPALVHLRSLCFVLLTAASERQQVAVSCCTDPLHLRISCHDAPLLRTFCLCR